MLPALQSWIVRAHMNLGAAIIVVVIENMESSETVGGDARDARRGIEWRAKSAFHRDGLADRCGSGVGVFTDHTRTTEQRAARGENRLRHGTDRKLDVAGCELRSPVGNADFVGSCGERSRTGNAEAATSGPRDFLAITEPAVLQRSLAECLNFHDGVATEIHPLRNRCPYHPELRNLGIRENLELCAQHMEPRRTSRLLGDDHETAIRSRQNAPWRSRNGHGSLADPRCRPPLHSRDFLNLRCFKGDQPSALPAHVDGTRPQFPHRHHVTAAENGATAHHHQRPILADPDPAREIVAAMIRRLSHRANLAIAADRLEMQIARTLVAIEIHAPPDRIPCVFIRSVIPVARRHFLARRIVHVVRGPWRRRIHSEQELAGRGKARHLGRQRHKWFRSRRSQREFPDVTSTIAEMQPVIGGVIRQPVRQCSQQLRSRVFPFRGRPAEETEMLPADDAQGSVAVDKNIVGIVRQTHRIDRLAGFRDKQLGEGNDFDGHAIRRRSRCRKHENIAAAHRQFPWLRGRQSNRTILDHVVAE